MLYYLFFFFKLLFSIYMNTYNYIELLFLYKNILNYDLFLIFIIVLKEIKLLYNNINYILFIYKLGKI